MKLLLVLFCALTLRGDIIPLDVNLGGGIWPITWPYYGDGGHVCDGYDGQEIGCVQTIPKPYTSESYLPPVVIIDPPYEPPIYVPPVTNPTPEPGFGAIIGLAFGVGMLAKRRRA